MVATPRAPRAPSFLTAQLALWGAADEAPGLFAIFILLPLVSGQES